MKGRAEAGITIVYAAKVLMLNSLLSSTRTKINEQSINFVKVKICKCVKCKVLKHNTATYETQHNYSNQNDFNEEKTESS